MVIAGPGTGKTLTLVNRIVYLVSGLKVDPSFISAVTFTNKAAAEMKERLLQKLPSDTVNAINIGTFHGLCLKLLRLHLQTNKELVVIDENTALAVIKELLTELSMTCPAPSDIIRDISRAKSQMRPVSESLDPETFRIYNVYQKKLASLGVFDFDDLLLRALELPDRSFFFHSRGAGHILVDEFQDINEVQYELVRKWGDFSGNIFVIGDPHQSIYGFRGSSPEFFDRFRHDYSDVAEIALNINYRSPSSFVESAISLISHSSISFFIPRTFTGALKEDIPIRIVESRSEFTEAIFVAKEINNLVGGVDMIDAHRYGVNRERKKCHYGFTDIAILYRTHRQADVLERCLVREGIPYCVAGKDGQLGEPSAAAIVAMIRFALNPTDVLSLITVLKFCKEPVDYALRYAGGERKIDNLLKIINNTMTESGYIRQRKFCMALEILNKGMTGKPPVHIIEELGAVLEIAKEEPVRRLSNIAELYDDLLSFVNTITLGQEADIVRRGEVINRGDAVLLSTLHAAKGLEFPVVFIIGADEGLLPLHNAHGETADIEEERRLFYVGITRARRQLIITTAAYRSLYGETVKCRKSPFISEMDNKYLTLEKFHTEPLVEQLSFL